MFTLTDNSFKLSNPKLQKVNVTLLERRLRQCAVRLVLVSTNRSISVCGLCSPRVQRWYSYQEFSIVF
jgi:hypothetical protein